MKFYQKYFIFSTILGLVMMGFAFHNNSVQESTASHKSDHAMVGGIFSAELKFEDIRKYYN